MAAHHATAEGAPARGRWSQLIAATMLVALLHLLGVVPAAAATVAATAVPTISSISPKIGVPGTAVRITGTGFSTTPANNTVTFGQVKATVTSATATVLTATAPSPRVSSKVRVRTAGGLSNSADFYMPPSPISPSDVKFTQRVSLGGSIRVTRNLVTDVAIVMFDAQAGQRTAIGVTDVTSTDARIRVFRPDGTQLKAQNTGLGGTFLDTMNLTTAGSYSIVVDSTTSGGALTLRLYNVPGDSTGTITRGTAQTVTTTAVGQNAIRTFSGTAGQRVALEFSGVTYALARLLFVHPNGTKLGTERHVRQDGPTAGLVETVTLPVTGTYQVKVDPIERATGSVRLLLHAVPADTTGTVAIGTPFTVSTVVGQNAVRTFSATAGQRVVLDATSHSYRGVFVSLVRPDGRTINSRSFGLNSGFLESGVLDTTGVHRIVIDPLETATGSMTMVVRSVPADSTGTATLGTAQTVTTTAMGQNAVRTFSATPGQRFTLEVSDVTYPVQVRVSEPEFDSNVTDPVQLDSSSEPYWTDLFGAPSTGTYRIEFDGIEKSFGSVRMLLRSVPPDDAGTLTPGEPSEVVTTAPGQNASRTFSGTEGERVVIDFADNTYGLANLQLTAPDGSHLLFEEQLFFEGRSVGIILPQTGTYVLSIDPFEQQTGSVTVTLHVAPPDDVGTLTVGGPAETITLAPAQKARRTFSVAAGDTVSVTLTGNTIPGETSVFIERPEGTRGFTLTGPNGQFTEDFPTAGEYVLDIRPSGAASGSLTVELDPA
jgi:hypothetical protein